MYWLPEGVDQVIAQVTIGDDGVIVGRLGDAVGDLRGPAALCGGIHHGVVAGHAPPAVGDAGVADHGHPVAAVAGVFAGFSAGRVSAGGVGTGAAARRQ